MIGTENHHEMITVVAACVHRLLNRIDLVLRHWRVVKEYENVASQEIRAWKDIQDNACHDLHGVVESMICLLKCPMRKWIAAEAALTAATRSYKSLTTLARVFASFHIPPTAAFETVVEASLQNLAPCVYSFLTVCCSGPTFEASKSKVSIVQRLKCGNEGI